MTPFERNYIIIAVLSLLLQVTGLVRDFSQPTHPTPPVTTSLIQPSEE